MVKDAVAAGQVGEVRAVIHYASSSLMHGHIHSIDTASYLIGDPAIAAVRGELLPRGLQVEGNHIPADPLATYQLRFANGVEAWSIPTAPWEFEVIGSEGCHSLVQQRGQRFTAPARHRAGTERFVEEVPVDPVTPRSTTQCCLEDLAAARESGQPTRGHIDVTHHITEATIAVAESHRRGRRVGRVAAAFPRPLHFSRLNEDARPTGHPRGAPYTYH